MIQPRLRNALDRWSAAGLIDAATADRIRAFEERAASRSGTHWPAILALAIGGVLLGAGVLLFVSAHWDRLSPAWRFALVLLMVAVFHAGGALAARGLAILATVLHGVGTLALGAGVFMAGQIFHLQEHWPGGIMLWALGAAAGWALLRDPVQLGLVAILVPVWLAGEWMVAAEEYGGALMYQAIFLTAATYLTAVIPGRDGAIRRVLAWLGGLALLPTAILLVTTSEWRWGERQELTPLLRIAGWGIGLIAPLGLAVLLRGRAAWMNGVAAAWTIILVFLARAAEKDPGVAGAYIHAATAEIGLYLWCALGSVGLVIWGIVERRGERINLGVAGFALTVTFFYFSSVMDKLGRSTSLISLGVLFLIGGWLLERARRRLIARISTGQS
jgi:uncharacterized membrane protein